MVFIARSGEEQDPDINAFIDFAADTFLCPKVAAVRLMECIATSYPSLFKYYVYMFYSDHNPDKNAKVYTILMPNDRIVVLKDTEGIVQGDCTFSSIEHAKEAKHAAERLLKRFK